ncbi:MAG: trypsin-like peptidase domain-containing protein [Candidatus Obscuribacter sp.]|nr:trypsin-like peptidase domain-containing protein [Candidatus Obscuribacter sp.]MBL0189476.1 trypsin-like peptidase domain-containing protein [Candidatus Obscuribacter sp.]MBP6350011.1 trypsin-like peptidase domain-containing protein [Candidatus Obscuribacter sp.]
MSEFILTPCFSVEEFVEASVKEAEIDSAEEWLSSLYKTAAPSLATLHRLDRTPVATAFVVHSQGILASDFSAVAHLDRRQGLAIFTNGQERKVTLLAFDVRANVSLFKIAEPVGTGAGLKALPLVRASTHKSNAIACISLLPGDRPHVAAGLLRGLKFDRRVEVICRLSGAVASGGSPIFNRQGRVTGIFNDRLTGLDKGAGAEHIHSLLKALQTIAMPQDGVLKIHSRVGVDHAPVRSLQHDVPSTLLSEEFERMRRDPCYKRKVDDMFAVNIEQTAVL